MGMLAFDFPEDTSGGPHFTDVPEGSTFYTHIETLFNLGVINGYGDNTFRPFNNVTRGQIVKIIVGAALKADPSNWVLEDPPDPTFSDAQPDSTFYRYIETAYSHGLVGGYPCGGPGEPCDDQQRPYFRVNNLATRAQISKIIYLAVTYPPGR